MRDATEFASKLIAPYSERIEELEEENRRLRDCLSDDADYARLLLAENEALRELARDYDKVLDDAVYVWGTVADFLGYGRKYDALHDRVRELGIEVSGE